MGQKLTEFLTSYLNKQSIFKNKKAVLSNYTPKNVPYREEEINHIASILAPSLRLEKPSNLFLYGKTGTGKTLVARHVTQNLTKIAEENVINLKVFYLNCKLKRVADTEYRLIAQLIREFGQDVPATGLPTDELYRLFVQALDKDKMMLVLILDEIDQLVNKVGDEILYNLTRLNSELKNSQISFIGISNDLMFIDNVDPRVKSSLSEEELVFPPYNAIQLQKILRQRAKEAFFDDVFEEGVIEKCAAYAAREHGDARRALELLRVAAELSERKGAMVIGATDIDEAENKIERDRVLDITVTQPKQVKITLYSILTIFNAAERETSIFTGDIYNTYKDICAQCGVKPLTQRRLSDILSELDMFGIINARVISKGRHGRTREIRLAVPQQTSQKILDLLDESLGLS